jgi:hypothetical protein
MRMSGGESVRSCDAQERYLAHSQGQSIGDRSRLFFALLYFGRPRHLVMELLHD